LSNRREKYDERLSYRWNRGSKIGGGLELLLYGSKKDVYLRCAYDMMRPYDEPEHEHHVLQA